MSVASEPHQRQRLCWKGACTFSNDCTNLRAGTWTLLGIDIAWLCGLLASVPVSPLSCGVEIPLGLNVSGVFMWSAFLIISIGCLSWNLRSQRKTLYAPIAVLHYFWFAILSQQPFSKSCWQIATPSLCELDAAAKHDDGRIFLRSYFDCSPIADTQMFVMLTLVILSPCVMPSFRCMLLTWVWLACAVCYVFLSGGKFADEFFNRAETLAKCGVLVFANVVALLKKYTLEHSMRKEIVDDEKQIEASKKLYDILEYMLPVHVISPMLQDPNAIIAEQISRVSILFIMMDNFEVKVESMDPYQLLNFLNRQFTRIDGICAEHQVTKIETVGEEYVAAVGVTPDDVEEDQKSGHATLLDRLVQVALEILQCDESEDVDFKMGIHTGPIVAGVIGQKLPRFRLFGDTINTAARMMQKGLPGHCQFGTETRHCLSDDVAVEDRGIVEMKGKGSVEVFLLVVPNRKSVATRRSSLRTRPTLIQRISDLSDIDLDDVLGSPGPFMQRRRETIFAGANLHIESSRKNSALESNPSRLRSSRRNSEQHFSQLLVDIGDAGASGGNWRETASVSMQKRCSRLHPFKDVFSEEMEELWYKWYHEIIVCTGIQRRLDRHLLLFLSFTLCQGVYICVMWARPQSNDLWSTRRLLKFLFANASAFIILGVLRLSSLNMRWLTSRPLIVQVLFTLAYAATGFSIFFSCDALANPDESVVCESSQVQQCALILQDAASAKAERGWSGEVWSLVVALIYSTWTMVNPFLFSQACLLGSATVIFIVVVHFGAFMSNLYFSTFSLCCFCGTLAINAAFAYRAESASRTRYKTIHKITFTQARIQEILNTLMPAGVIDQLKTLKPDDPPPSHFYNSVTLSQSDLVGFTKLASTRTPSEVVEIIGKLFGRFDELTDKHRLCKVETVGDAYLAAQGSWPLTQTHSPFDVILFGLEVVQATKEFAQQHRPPLPIGCRLGVDTGECVGGIVGCEMQRYHLFGALLHRVELLESTAPEGQVQVGCACRQAAELLETTSEDSCRWSFRFVERSSLGLATSKGDPVPFEAVGGRPFLITG